MAALLAGHLVPGFRGARDPLALAGTTIYLPSRRSARALASTLAAHLGTTAFLPRIRALGALEDESGGLDADLFGEDPLGTLDPAIDPLPRRMILTRLILGWSASVRQALVGVGPEGRRETVEGEAFAVATTAADAWHLAGELATLLDELAIEEVPWHAVTPLGTDAFDRYWAITLDFLNIAVEQWPAILAERGRVDPAVRQARLIEAEIARLQRPGAPADPVIVAGAIGSNAATGRLMAAIARLPHGAVVLPGLDQHLDAEAWNTIDGARFDAGSAAGHPQSGLRRLLGALGLERRDVVAFGSISPVLAARGRLVSEALRPADTTHVWQGLLASPATLDVEAALGDVAVIEAADEREEALALALALRESLDGPGTAVLVTPDRTLARRVKEELTRWGIVIDDSGGESLPQTRAGALARLTLEAVLQDMAPGAVLALLAHPAVRLGRPRAEVVRSSRLAELALLRATLPDGALLDPPGLVAAARERAGAPHAPSALRKLDADDFATLEALFEDVLAALEPLRRAGRDLPGWVAAHDQAVAILTETDAGGTALGGVDGHALLRLFDELGEAADPAIGLDLSGYAALFDRIAADVPVRGPERSHPRLKILGLIEARLLATDRVLLGGLDETVWPPQVRGNAFLNRPMRAALGLSPPERRIGQAAHDFTMALGQPEVIISRAGKRGGAPTVPSRFLQRLAALGGRGWRDAQERGKRYLNLARTLDRPVETITIPRPCPRPPVALRPMRLSVTRIETLRRDPYAIYAERVLKLSRLDPVGAPAGPRDWGTTFHALLSDFVGRHPHGPVPAEAEAALVERVAAAFETATADAAFRAFFAPRLQGWAKNFVAWEAARRDEIAALAVEAGAEHALTLRDGSTFTLTAHADRLETTRTGGVRIIDFKTGRVPKAPEVRAGFAPQLTLEAALATLGGFEALGPDAEVEDVLYVGFNNRAKLDVVRLAWKDQSLREVVDEHLTGLVRLLSDFRDPSQGYLARPYPQFTSRFSDYDHLSRVKEWSVNGNEAEDA